MAVLEVGTWPDVLPCIVAVTDDHTTRSGMAAHDSGPALWITCHVHPEDGRRWYTLKMASVVGGALV